MNITTYNIKDKKTPIVEQYPELAYMLSGIVIESDSNILIDDIQRFVIFFYDKKCFVHQIHPNILKAREAAAIELNISLRKINDKEWSKAECEMAARYMLCNRHNEFSLFVTLSFQFENLNKQLRSMDGTSTWTENLNSLKSSEVLIEQSERLTSLRRSIFGDFDYIEAHMMQKAVDEKYIVENSMR